MSKGIYIDSARCIYCRACEVACEREHDGHSFMLVILFDERYSIPMNCRHCEKPLCVVVCPTKALTKMKLGAVILEGTKCIGCQLCGIVCPFGIIALDITSKVVRKCDLCQGRLTEDKVPACVATCPAQALIYDEFDNLTRRVKEGAATALTKRWVR